MASATNIVAAAHGAAKSPATAIQGNASPLALLHADHDDVIMHFIGDWIRYDGSEPEPRGALDLRTLASPAGPPPKNYQKSYTCGLVTGGDSTHPPQPSCDDRPNVLHPLFQKCKKYVFLSPIKRGPRAPLDLRTLGTPLGPPSRNYKKIQRFGPPCCCFAASRIAKNAPITRLGFFSPPSLIFISEPRKSPTHHTLMTACRTKTRLWSATLVRSPIMLETPPLHLEAPCSRHIGLVPSQGTFKTPQPTAPRPTGPPNPFLGLAQNKIRAQPPPQQGKN